MKIAVNTRLLLKDKLEGIGWFTYETFKRITQAHPEHEFIFIFDREYDKSFVFSNNVKPVVAFPPARHPLLWYLFFDWAIPHILKKEKADLFISPEGYMSLRTSVPSFAVIHDLNFEHHPEYLPKINQWYYQYFFHRFAKKANRIATVSEFTKKDIQSCYGIEADKIDVVYNGANTRYTAISQDEIDKVRKQFTDGKPYFLFIGLLHPRKNITRLIQAFDCYRNEHLSDVKLIIVGEKKWWTEDMRKAYESSVFKDDILLMGRQNPKTLSKLLPSALALTYVPIFEGFGIPILEAFSCDLPVITSNTTSMPEVGADAVELVNPFDIQSIAQAMQKVASNEQLRQEMIIKGRKRRQDFSWYRTADLLWLSIEKMMKEIKS
ncbi:MAG: glycosyltransferase family 4 protein [Flavobacteriales bacterium]